MTYQDYKYELQTAPIWELKNVIAALSGNFAAFINSDDDKVRLKAAKAVLRERTRKMN